MKGLEQIQFAITNYSAMAFAETKLKAEKDAPNRDYYSYMSNCYSGKDNPTIEECEENAMRQFIGEYGKCCEIYAGWLKNGKVFILSRKQKFILFLYKKDNDKHSAVTHYNPLDIDCFEWGMSNEHFFKGLENGDYDLSIDEHGLIKECDELIRYSNHS